MKCTELLVHNILYLRILTTDNSRTVKLQNNYNSQGYDLIYRKVKNCQMLTIVSHPAHSQQSVSKYNVGVHRSCQHNSLT